MGAFRDGDREGGIGALRRSAWPRRRYVATLRLGSGTTSSAVHRFGFFEDRITRLDARPIDRIPDDMKALLIEGHRDGVAAHLSGLPDGHPQCWRYPLVPGW